MFGPNSSLRKGKIQIQTTLYAQQDTKSRAQFQLTSTGYLNLVIKPNVLTDSEFSVNLLIRIKDERKRGGRKREKGKKEQRKEVFKIFYLMLS